MTWSHMHRALISLAWGEEDNLEGQLGGKGLLGGWCRDSGKGCWAPKQAWVGKRLEEGAGNEGVATAWSVRNRGRLAMHMQGRHGGWGRHQARAGRQRPVGPSLDEKVQQSLRSCTGFRSHHQFWVRTVTVL